MMMNSRPAQANELHRSASALVHECQLEAPVDTLAKHRKLSKCCVKEMLAGNWQRRRHRGELESLRIS